MSGPRPSAVLFDNDGLLLDSESVWTHGEADLFERYGSVFTLEHKHALVGTNVEIAGALLERELAQPGRGAELMEELDELVVAELEQGVDPMPGAREIVGKLRAAGTPIALVSNSPVHFIDRALDLVGLAGEFDAVVSGHEVAAPKPAPYPYLEACRQLGVEPDRDVFVLEDSPTGVAAGVAAGATVVGVPSLDGVDLSGAHVTVSSLEDSELLGILGLE